MRASAQRVVAPGKSSGDGTVVIASARSAKCIPYNLDFNHDTHAFQGAIRSTNTNDGLLVKWTHEAKLGANPLKRWASLAMGLLMGGDMEKGLANLKRRIEAKP